MSEIQQLLQQMPVQQIAQQAGVDEDQARQALEAIVPTLVGGMQANAADPAGEQSLLGALSAHQGRLDQRLNGQDIDVADGEKIVHNIFGDNTDQIARAAGGGSALGPIIQKILPIVAPIVLAWLANKLFSGGGLGGMLGGDPQQQAQQPSGGGFDSPFGQGSAGAQNRIDLPTQSGGQALPQGGGLGDILGGMLGGGAGQQAGAGSNPLGPLGDILGGLLGGGRR